MTTAINRSASLSLEHRLMRWMRGLSPLCWNTSSTFPCCCICDYWCVLGDKPPLINSFIHTLALDKTESHWQPILELGHSQRNNQLRVKIVEQELIFAEISQKHSRSFISLVHRSSSHPLSQGSQPWPHSTGSPGKFQAPPRQMRWESPG